MVQNDAMMHIIDNARMLRPNRGSRLTFPLVELELPGCTSTRFVRNHFKIGAVKPKKIYICI